jgi:hypothetical protein
MGCNGHQERNSVDVHDIHCKHNIAVAIKSGKRDMHGDGLDSITLGTCGRPLEGTKVRSKISSAALMS